jgi:putative membrane protein insertion efficiency factor
MAEINKNKVMLFLRKAISAPVIGLLYFYRWFISPLLGPRCRFYPSCSEYAIAAVQNHGIIRGLFLSVKRLLKCHPWHSGGVDPIPMIKKKRIYDKRF